jgi:UDP-glucose 4-epimerase
MPPKRHILVTGATGKVGQAFVNRILNDLTDDSTLIRALCHNRVLAPHKQLEIVRGSISDRDVVNNAMQDITHVLHLATSKESPDTIMDIAVKGLFWMLEACRESDTFQQFIMVGGDAVMGHYFYPYPAPVTEEHPHTAYPGCYALSKVLEEVMLEQYYVQYGLNGCCLRAPWIMEKDDFRYHLSFGDDVFGVPLWREIVGATLADEYIRTRTVPVMLDAKGESMRRNVIHLNDLVDAMFKALDNPAAHQQTFNICMDEPIDYRSVGNYLSVTRDCQTVDIESDYHSTWLDNSKAKFLLDWRPQYNMERLIDEAFNYKPDGDSPRTLQYRG